MVFCSIIQVLTLATSISVGTGGFFFFVCVFFFVFSGRSQTRSCTAPHKQQLQTARFPVPPQPPAQEGPIKTSHITPSLCLCVPSLLRVGKKKKKREKQSELHQLQSCGLTVKNLFTCLNFDLSGAASVVANPSPTLPFMYSSRAVPL